MFLSLWKSNVWKNSKKKAAKKKTAATKTGEHVGKKAGDKIVKMFSKSGESKKVRNAPKTVTFNGNVTVKTISRKKGLPLNPPLLLLNVTAPLLLRRS